MMDREEKDKLVSSLVIAFGHPSSEEERGALKNKADILENELEKRGLAILPSHYKVTGGEHFELESDAEFIVLIRYYTNLTSGAVAWLDRVTELTEGLKRRIKRQTQRV